MYKFEIVYNEKNTITIFYLGVKIKKLNFSKVIFLIYFYTENYRAAEIIFFNDFTKTVKK